MTTKINADANGLTETVDTSGILEIQTNGTAAVIIGVDQNANFTSTGAITVPAGTTAQRPTPVNGMMRYNSNVAVFEVYANNTWAAANVTPAPTNTVAPVISGSAVVGQNLTCTTGTWSGSPSAYFYQWRANSTAISNATANVFTLTSTQIGANITCNVTAFNAAGNSTPATSNSLGPVVQGVTVSYLIVAGGGGGGGVMGGGGGAGGLQTGTTLLQPANTYAITIGSGGAGGSSGSYNGSQGSNSSIATLTASVGGGGGGGGSSNGLTGGSGGGGGYNGSGGAGTSGQGNAGGYGLGADGYPGGGGGGAGAAGQNAPSTSQAGNGGNGATSTISGVATYYAGGGGGGGRNTSPGSSPGTGGLGGGGNGSASSGATAGTANLGGGGGGAGYDGPSYPGAAGGSGIVIISYAGAQQFGGGVISTDGSNTIHTFTTSGSLVPLTALNSSYIIVGGGGGGGAVCGGGGGGGGFYSGSNVTIDANSTYTIVVGAGGTAGPTAASSFGGAGGNSTFSMTSNVAIGGGYGGGGFYSVAAYNGGNGASGGGGGGYWSMGQTSGGTGTAGQGYNGGNALNGTGYPGGGGGGFSSAGANATASQGGNGGNGVSSSISGTLTYYAGGGGGGTSAGSAGAAGLGGAAGSGSGAGSSASAGTGGGGGGGNQSSAGGAGGSGTVIISYPGSTPMMAGGNVTVVSNTVVHTFTSSGYLTPFVLFNNSLRFRSSASASLSRTPTIQGNRQKWTWSGWVKRGLLNDQQVLFAGFVDTGNYTLINTYQDSFIFQCAIASSLDVYQVSTAVFRDPAAWYHIVYAIDTTQATAANRAKMYVNGVQITSFSTNTQPSQNYNTFVNATNTHFFGKFNNNLYFDGYMASVYFVDGQQLTPNAFGTFNQYGVWQPVAYAGSYGTNGFYLPFTNTANTTALGYDFSPQGNNWTPTNISLTAGATYDSMTDVPTLTSANVANYCVLNPLDKDTNITLSDGNLKAVGYNAGCTATFGLTSGKWYWEVIVVDSYAGTTWGMFGVSSGRPNSYVSGYTGYPTGAGVFVSTGGGTGGTWSGGSLVTGQTTWANNDVIGLAFDATNLTLDVYRNNTKIGSTLTVPSGAIFPSFYQNGTSGDTSTSTENFGQQPFVYTPPAGYLPLNTYNM